MTSTTRYRIIESTVGPLTLAGDDDDVLTHLTMDEQRHVGDRPESWLHAPHAFAAAVEQLEAYFAKELTTFDVPLRLSGTPFQERVWAALLDIPFGQTESYGALATRIGHPGAARAVGLANGRNPISIIVPCHRVVGASGTLTGYGGGLDRKRVLLELEAAQLTMIR